MNLVETPSVSAISSSAQHAPSVPSSRTVDKHGWYLYCQLRGLGRPVASPWAPDEVKGFTRMCHGEGRLASSWTCLCPLWFHFGSHFRDLMLITREVRQKEENHFLCSRRLLLPATPPWCLLCFGRRSQTSGWHEFCPQLDEHVFLVLHQRDFAGLFPQSEDGEAASELVFPGCFLCVALMAVLPSLLPSLLHLPPLSPPLRIPIFSFPISPPFLP